MSRLVPVLATVALAGSAALARPADATVNLASRLPGASCQTAYAEGSTVYDPGGGLYNTAGDWWRTAICPIPGSAGAQLFANADVYVHDRHYDLDVNCRVVLSSIEGDGWTVWGATASTTGSSPKPQRLLMWNNPGALTGHAFLHCYLPPTYQGNRSGILGYTVNSMSQ